MYSRPGPVGNGGSGANHVSGRSDRSAGVGSARALASPDPLGAGVGDGVPAQAATRTTKPASQARDVPRRITVPGRLATTATRDNHEVASNGLELRLTTVARILGPPAVERSETVSRPARSRATALFRRIAGPLLMRSGALSILEVSGRRTGTAQFVTIFPIEVEGSRYLVSQYGACDWVRNIRAAGRATLHRKGRAEAVTATEVDGAERDAVLAAYGRKLRGPEGRDFRASSVAADRPTFRLESAG